MPDDTKLSENSSITSAKYDLSDGLFGYGQVEVQRLLHQFSEQLITKLVDADKLTSELCFGSKNDVDRVISLFGTNGDIGKTLEYQGVIGYDPKHIQQSALKYSIQKNDLHSEFLGVGDMREYGSGSELGW
ncbi:hypothetical protein FBU30_009540 [Linnemannia zychae]|nr:hypothetical protein FBU30_009540 [Linnemannia zychae]